jgi:hypothetical protein
MVNAKVSLLVAVISIETVKAENEHEGDDHLLETSANISGCRTQFRKHRRANLRKHQTSLRETLFRTTPSISIFHTATVFMMLISLEPR